MSEIKKMSFPMAMRDYFGKRDPNEPMTAFMAELKALTPEDKAFFREALKTVGYEIT